MVVPSRMGTPGPAGRDPDDDGVLIARSVGDPEQFAAVFRRHAPQIQRYVVRRLGADAAEDVVAETFLTAFRLRSRYQPDRPDARPWLYGIATNLTCGYYGSSGSAWRWPYCWTPRSSVWCSCPRCCS
jgi:DNA-directed RNA polymerase specialized sigma24 family protein